jgi:hypothetical protein
MSETYTAVDTGPFVGAYTMPQGSDTRNIASVRTPMEAMADDIAYLKSLIEPDFADEVLIAAAGTPVLDKHTGATTAAFSIVRADASGSNPGGFILSQSGVETADITYFPVAIWEIDLPDGSEMTGVGARVEGSSGGPHGALPSKMPAARLMRMPMATGVPEQIVAATDAAADVTAYEAAHTISATTSGITVDRETCRYFVTVEGEAGTNATDLLSVYSAWAKVKPVRADKRAA